MKTQNYNPFDYHAIKIVYGVLAMTMLMLSGCTLFGFLASEGPFESKRDPEYNLLAQQDRKILLWVEFPRSMNIGYDTQDKLVAAFSGYLLSEVKIKPSNLMVQPRSSENNILDPKEVARSKGAGYVLLVQVDVFEVDSLQIQNYVTGQVITRSVLLDVDLPTAVWPQQPEGKMIQIGVEVEAGGRNAVISRLVSGAAQCTIRYLYPCDKLKFKNSDERVSVQEAFEIETY